MSSLKLNVYLDKEMLYMVILIEDCDFFFIGFVFKCNYFFKHTIRLGFSVFDVIVENCDLFIMQK